MRVFHESHKSFDTYHRCIWLSSGLSKKEVRLGFVFDKASIEQHISSPSFRKFRMPNKYAKCVHESYCRSKLYKTTITGLLTPGDEDTVTIAELLEEVVSDVPAGGKILKVIFNDIKFD